MLVSSSFFITTTNGGNVLFSTFCYLFFHFIFFASNIDSVLILIDIFAHHIHSGMLQGFSCLVLFIFYNILAHLVWMFYCGLALFFYHLIFKCSFIWLDFFIVYLLSFMWSFHLLQHFMNFVLLWCFCLFHYQCLLQCCNSLSP